MGAGQLHGSTSPRLNTRPGSGCPDGNPVSSLTGVKIMSRVLVVATFSLLVGGCATGSGGLEGEAGLSQETGGLSVLSYQETFLPRAAFIAIFELPGGGNAALLFPTREADREKRGPGIHYLQGIIPASVKAQRELYGPRATRLYNGAFVRGEVAVLVVASDEPLNLEPFSGTLTGIRDLLLQEGCNNEHCTQEALLRVLIPNPGLVEWEYTSGIVLLPRSWETRR